jgi:hypothetical protein
MPIRQSEINYSLYSDDNPKTTTPGLGFKHKNIATQSIAILKKLPKKQQTKIANLMIQRAKHHPHRNRDMEDAIQVY